MDKPKEPGIKAVLDAIDHYLIEKEVEIAWDGCYPYCPTCGSRNVPKDGDGRRGKIWSFCPDCGQKLKIKRIGRQK